jgi:hypothetical protein
MARSYVADIDQAPPAWARVRVVDGVPVSFMIVDPDRQMAFPGGEVRYAFICDVATREERRREGHFRALMAHVFDSLRAARIPLVVTHGRYPLYRRFGFDVFTHHSGIFATPEQIERTLGVEKEGAARPLLAIEEHRAFWDDVLVVTGVKAGTMNVCKAALRAAVAIARERGKARILFEHPPAPSYGSRYPIYSSPETPLTVLARTCGARACVQGADPEGSPVPDADWIKVLDAAGFVGRVFDVWDGSSVALPRGVVCLETDAGAVTIACDGARASVSEGIQSGAYRVAWPSSALAQLVTGYRCAETLGAIYGSSCPEGGLALLRALFPRRWRFSRNESWTFRAD